jgi:hypothetical protein
MATETSPQDPVRASRPPGPLPPVPKTTGRTTKTQTPGICRRSPRVLRLERAGHRPCQPGLAPDHQAPFRLIRNPQCARHMSPRTSELSPESQASGTGTCRALGKEDQGPEHFSPEPAGPSAPEPQDQSTSALNPRFLRPRRPCPGRFGLRPHASGFGTPEPPCPGDPAPGASARRPMSLVSDPRVHQPLRPQPGSFVLERRASGSGTQESSGTGYPEPDHFSPEAHASEPGTHVSPGTGYPEPERFSSEGHISGPGTREHPGPRHPGTRTL